MYSRLNTRILRHTHTLNDKHRQGGRHNERRLTSGKAGKRGRLEWRTTRPSIHSHSLSSHDLHVHEFAFLPHSFLSFPPLLSSSLPLVSSLAMKRRETDRLGARERERLSDGQNRQRKERENGSACDARMERGSGCVHARHRKQLAAIRVETGSKGRMNE